MPVSPGPTLQYSPQAQPSASVVAATVSAAACSVETASASARATAYCVSRSISARCRALVSCRKAWKTVSPHSASTCRVISMGNSRPSRSMATSSMRRPAMADLPLSRTRRRPR
ncbi:hypothetical protein GCM10018955_19030 [Planomonospora venezuelensis]